MSDLETIVADRVLDARELSCPGPLLEARRALGELETGQTLEIQSGALGVREDIPAWCRKAGHEYLGLIERKGYASLFVTRRR